jgi:hypothetical protein
MMVDAQPQASNSYHGSTFTVDVNDKSESDNRKVGESDDTPI